MDYQTTGDYFGLQGIKVFFEAFTGDLFFFSCAFSGCIIFGYELLIGDILAEMLAFPKKEWEHLGVPKHYHSLTKTILTASEQRR